MRTVTLLVCCLVVPAVVHAEYYLCGDTTRVVSLQQADPSHVPPCPAPYTQTALTKASPGLAVIAAQVATWQSPPLDAQSRPRPDYLKVVSGLIVEKDAGEKTAVDAALAAAAAARQALIDEANTTNDFCATGDLTTLQTLINARKATLQGQITTLHTNVQTQIDAIAAANLTSLKAGLTGLNDALQTSNTNIVDEIYLVVRKMAGCIVTLRKGVR
jgi:hypothetical protein